MHFTSTQNSQSTFKIIAKTQQKCLHILWEYLKSFPSDPQSVWLLINSCFAHSYSSSPGDSNVCKAHPWHTGCVPVLSLWSCPALCNPVAYSPPGPSAHGLLQVRTLEWVAISFSKRSYRKKVKLLSHVRLFATPWTVCSLPGSSIHGIFQAISDKSFNTIVIKSNLIQVHESVLEIEAYLCYFLAVWSYPLTKPLCAWASLYIK